MSEAEIQYLIPKLSRRDGDTEAIVNAMGDFLAKKPFPLDRDYEMIPIDTVTEAAFIRLIKTTQHDLPRHDLLEQAEKMRDGVERHFSDQDRVRLTRRYVGIAIRDELETE